MKNIIIAINDLFYKNADWINYLTLTTKSSSVWSPDLYFTNEKTSKFHDIIVSNNFIRIYPNGDVLHSTRFFIKILILIASLSPEY